MHQWGCSSAGRAPALQAGGQEFDSPHLHQTFLSSYLDNCIKMLEIPLFKKEILTNLEFLFIEISQVSKGVRRMPWPYQPKKDAISCDKLR